MERLDQIKLHLLESNKLGVKTYTEQVIIFENIK